MSDLTPAELDALADGAEEILARCDAATPGPWWNESGMVHAKAPEWTPELHTCCHPAKCGSDEDAKHVACARVDLPAYVNAFLAERKRRQAEYDSRIKWQGLIYNVCNTLDAALGLRVTRGTGLLVEEIPEAIRRLAVERNRLRDLETCVGELVHATNTLALRFWTSGSSGPPQRTMQSDLLAEIERREGTKNHERADNH